MRLVVFFALLCSLLLKGNACIHASILHNNTSHSLTVHPPKRHTSKLNNSGQNFFAIDNWSSDTEDETLVSDDDEDDEDTAFNLSSGYKYSAQYQLQAFISHVFLGEFPDYKCVYFNASPDFVGRVSPKYILQGVLRI